MLFVSQNGLTQHDTWFPTTFVSQNIYPLGYKYLMQLWTWKNETQIQKRNPKNVLGKRQHSEA